MHIAWVGAAIVAVTVVVTFSILVILQRLDRGAPRAPGSPVPWIADGVWRTLNPEGLAQRSVALLGHALGAAVIHPTLIAVGDEDRRRAPIHRSPGGAVPPAGTIDQQRTRLAQTPGRGKIHSPVWPYCCERLATVIACQGGRAELAAIEGASGPLDRAYLDGELDTWGGPGADRSAFKAQGWGAVLAGMREGTHSGEGISIYCCRACGRVYVASCAPG